MAKIFPPNFECVGRPEYVLLKAGLFTLHRTEGEMRPEPTPLLARFFQGTPVPPLDDLVPALNLLVGYLNMQRGGVLDLDRERVTAMEAMAAVGVGNSRGDLGRLMTRISGVMDEVAEERRDRVLAPPL